MTSQSYADLLALRVENDERPIIREKVCLKPRLFADLTEARDEYDRLKAATRDSTGEQQPTRNGGPLAAARERVEKLEAEVLATSIRVTLSAFAGAKLAELTKATEDSLMVERWRVFVAEAFVEANTLDGEPLPQITKEKWAALVRVASSGELMTWYSHLDNLSAAPEFPTRAR